MKPQDIINNGWVARLGNRWGHWEVRRFPGENGRWGTGRWDVGIGFWVGYKSRREATVAFRAYLDLFDILLSDIPDDIHIPPPPCQPHPEAMQDLMEALRDNGVKIGVYAPPGHRIRQYVPEAEECGGTDAYVLDASYNLAGGEEVIYQIIVVPGDAA